MNTISQEVLGLVESLREGMVKANTLRKGSTIIIDGQKAEVLWIDTERDVAAVKYADGTSGKIPMDPNSDVQLAQSVGGRAWNAAKSAGRAVAGAANAVGDAVEKAGDWIDPSGSNR